MIVAIIQARMGSKRLPGKTNLPFGDSTVIEYLLKRVKKSKKINKIVLATTSEPEDDIIENISKKHGAYFFRGHQTNVLKRYYDAAKYYKASIIVRLTGDDPFKTASIIDLAVKTLQKFDLDYCSNTLDITFPEGLDVEVFTFSALRNAFIEANKDYEYEHVTPYIWENKKNNFRIGQIVTKLDRSNWRMTIDYDQDYRSLIKLEKLVRFGCNYREIVKMVEKNKLKSISHPSIKRNEAYNGSKF